MLVCLQHTTEFLGNARLVVAPWCSLWFLSRGTGPVVPVRMTTAEVRGTVVGLARRPLTFLMTVPSPPVLSFPSPGGGGPRIEQYPKT